MAELIRGAALAHDEWTWVRLPESTEPVRKSAGKVVMFKLTGESAAPDEVEGLRSRTEGSRRLVLVGEPPPATVQVDGCAFHPRCPWRADRCEEVDPVATDRGEGQRVCCHHPLSAEQNGSDDGVRVGDSAGTEPGPPGAARHAVLG